MANVSNVEYSRYIRTRRTSSSFVFVSEVKLQSKTINNKVNHFKTAYIWDCYIGDIFKLQLPTKVWETYFDNDISVPSGQVYSIEAVQHSNKILPEIKYEKIYNMECIPSDELFAQGKTLFEGLKDHVVDVAPAPNPTKITKVDYDELEAAKEYYNEKRTVVCPFEIQDGRLYYNGTWIQYRTAEIEALMAQWNFNFSGLKAPRPPKTTKSSKELIPAVPLGTVRVRKLRL
jgi:hypothetical protein